MYKLFFTIPQIVIHLLNAKLRFHSTCSDILTCFPYLVATFSIQQLLSLHLNVCKAIESRWNKHASPRIDILNDLDKEKTVSSTFTTPSLSWLTSFSMLLQLITNETQANGICIQFRLNEKNEEWKMVGNDPSLHLLA